jgi:hypothetical protein
MITQNDLAIINNLKKISDQMYFTTDGILRVKHETSIYVVAKLETVFARPFGIYSVQTLLNILSSYKDYQLEYKPDCLEIISGSSKLKYKYSAVVQEVPLVKLPDVSHTFNLTSEGIKQLQKHSRTLHLPLLRIYTDKFTGELVLQLTNSEQESAHSYEIKCGKCPIELDEVLDFESVSLLDIDYVVGIKPGAFIKFKCDSSLIDVTYYYSFRQ